MGIKPVDRYPVVAGYFYPSDPDKLVDIIKKSFLHPIGPGKLPVVAKSRDKNTYGYVSPHAGYIYSGPVAAHVYYDLARTGRPETLVILGTNHTGIGALVSVYPAGKWITPLGELEVDEELARGIVTNSKFAELDTDAHVEEHSIEVQLPFIQYIYGDKVKIAPIVIGLHTPEVAKDLARSIYDASISTSRDIVLIASSDFNHYDPHDITVKKDQLALERILMLDTEGFHKVIIDENVTVCGPGAIMTVMEYTKLLAGENASVELLKHATSGDTSGMRDSVVGYAAIKFYKKS